MHHNTGQDCSPVNQSDIPFDLLCASELALNIYLHLSVCCVHNFAIRGRCEPMILQNLEIKYCVCANVNLDSIVTRTG